MIEQQEFRKLESPVSNITNSRWIQGYALKFNTISEKLWDDFHGIYRETILPTALDGVIERSDVFATLNHDKDKGVLARSKNGKGTLNLIVDSIGLMYDFEAMNNDLGNTTLEHLSRGNIDSSSFVFSIKECTWDRQADGTYLRTIIAFDKLFDISPVFAPAYLDTSVYKRFIEMQEKVNEAEQRQVQEIEKPAEQPTEVTDQVDSEPMEVETEQVTETENKPVEPTEQPDEVNTDEPVQTDEEVKEVVEEENRNITDEVPTDSVEKENTNNKNKEKRKMENFKLISAINAVVNNRNMGDDEQNVVNEARKAMSKAGLSYAGQIQIPVAESRAISEGSGVGLETVGTEKAGLELPLRANLSLVKAGAKMYTGLINNLSIPVYGGSTFTTEDETADAKDGSGAFSQVDFAPKRITGFLPISKTLLAQDSVNVEAGIMSDIVAKLAEKIEELVFGTQSGSTKTPAGLFNGVTGSTAATYSGVTATVAALENANVNNYQWVVNPSAKAILKSTQINQGTQLWKDNEVDGVPAMSSSLLPAKSYVVGDFGQYVIAQWGAIDITVDPYSLAKSNQIQLVVNAYFDLKPLRADAFVKGYFA